MEEETGYSPLSAYFGHDDGIGYSPFSEYQEDE